MKNLTAKKIEKWANNRGLHISIGKATDWVGSLNHAERWGQGAVSKRARAYSRYSESYHAWIEPVESFENLAALFDDLKDWVKNNDYA